MANLASRDSFFQDLFDFRRDFDQMFSRMLSGRSGSQNQPSRSLLSFAPAVDSYIDKDGKTFHCCVSLPGIDPQNVEIHAQGNTLSISGERKETRSEKDVDRLQNEIWYGSFERILPLPEGVDTNKISAEYRDGILEITAPISANALPRRIEIKSSPKSRQMTA